ncbi:MAG: hypothetical protein NC131_14250, partial [Roseburia sp.]|nr:hypothetical protein [Roseburia sp.]
MDRKRPNYVLKFYDCTGMDVNGGGPWGVVQKICIAIVAVWLVASLVFHENMFGKLTGYSLGTLWILFLYSSLHKKHEWVPFPVEISFYDDYLTVYYERHIYDGGRLRQEWAKFEYQNIKQVLWSTRTMNLFIQGRVHGIYTWYDKNGNLEATPSYDRI